jgi:hypothetical protein
MAYIIVLDIQGSGPHECIIHVRVEMISPPAARRNLAALGLSWAAAGSDLRVTQVSPAPS